MGADIRVAAALSTSADTVEAAHEAAERVADGLGGDPDLALVFFSPHHRDRAPAIVDALATRLRPRALIGCTGESIVGGSREIEQGPALSLWSAVLGNCDVETFHSHLVHAPEGHALAGFPDLARVPDAGAVLLLADPFTYPADALLRLGADRFGPVPFLGGMASGGAAPGEQRLISDAEVHEAGAVGVVLRGDVPLRSIVSQGCRPIGEPYVVTKAEGNVLHELAGRPAVERLQETVAGLGPEDRSLVTQGLHVGVVVDEQKESFERGDFLIRGVLGADPEAGSLAVGERMDVGRTVQFHVRDADTADEDLRQLCSTISSRPAGALLFTCNGRGSRLFPGPDHDVSVIRETVGDLPVAGFFCQGEIGPVGGRSFLHGFTASAAFFG